MPPSSCTLNTGEKTPSWCLPEVCNLCLLEGQPQQPVLHLGCLRSMVREFEEHSPGDEMALGCSGPPLWNPSAPQALALWACDGRASPKDLWSAVEVILPLPWTIGPGFCLDGWPISPLSWRIAASFCWDGSSTAISLSIQPHPWCSLPLKLSYFFQY